MLHGVNSLTLACGGEAVNSVDDISEASLGHAGSVYEHIIGEDKYVISVLSRGSLRTYTPSHTNLSHQ